MPPTTNTITLDPTGFRAIFTVERAASLWAVEAVFDAGLRRIESTIPLFGDVGDSFSVELLDFFFVNAAAIEDPKPPNDRPPNPELIEVEVEDVGLVLAMSAMGGATT
mmetsp:Transcript_22434/g.42039  ORF Transcript_22434/g.42039 Transcript_22434/m.42039 type:complete len:108 (+) Transcript_22434:415-738(+)